MKISIQKQLLIGILAFMTFITGLVIASMRQDVGLVSKDYYKQEIEYQDHIDKVKRTNAMNKNLQFIHDEDLEIFHIKFPLEKEEIKKLGGTIHLFRPSDTEKDVKIPALPDQEGLQNVDLSNLDKGLWKLIVSWNLEGIEFYDDKVLIIN